MNKDITTFERDVIIGAMNNILSVIGVMNNILSVKAPKFPFPDFEKFFIKPKWDPLKSQNDQKLSFYQLLKVPDELTYLD